MVLRLTIFLIMNIEIKNPDNGEIIFLTLVEPKFVNFDLKQVNKDKAVGIAAKGVIKDGIESPASIKDFLIWFKSQIINWESL